MPFSKKYSTKIKPSPIIIALLVLMLTFGGGFWVGRESIPPQRKVTEVTHKSPPQGVKADFSLFWEVWNRLEDTYIEKEALNPRQMVYGAIQGMVKSLGDPYTEFMKPETSKSFKENISGSFEGIGAEIGIKNGTLTVIAPLKGTPAEKAGLRSGDQIIKVDDKPTTDLTLQEAVNLIRGPKQTKVTLTIVRDSLHKAKEITITRGVIKIPVIDWEIKQDNIAYIQLYHFTENSPRLFRKTAQEILSSPAKKIILDLRDNPGGYLEAAVDIGGWFIEKGKVVAIEDFGGDKEDRKYKASGPGLLKNFPLVVLINQGSASASEILAASLRYHKHINIVGRQSFGKGSVQTLENFKDGSTLKVTIAKWLTPQGVSISGQGIKPDFAVKYTDEDFNANRDPQLDKAIELLK